MQGREALARQMDLFQAMALLIQSGLLILEQQAIIQGDRQPLHIVGTQQRRQPALQTRCVWL